MRWIAPASVTLICMLSGTADAGISPDALATAVQSKLQSLGDGQRPHVTCRQEESSSSQWRCTGHFRTTDQTIRFSALLKVKSQRWRFTGVYVSASPGDPADELFSR